LREEHSWFILTLETEKNMVCALALYKSQTKHCSPGQRNSHERFGYQYRLNQIRACVPANIVFSGHLSTNLLCGVTQTPHLEHMFHYAPVDLWIRLFRKPIRHIATALDQYFQDTILLDASKHRANECFRLMLISCHTEPYEA